MTNWARWRAGVTIVSLRWSRLALCLLVGFLASPWNIASADDEVGEPVLTAPGESTTDSTEVSDETPMSDDVSSSAETVEPDDKKE